MVATGTQIQMKDDKPNLLEVVLSVFAAALGVQNSKNRERDFTHGSPIVFIVAGLIFTIIFVVTIVTIVHLVT
ncbi:MAG: DUF2970 domain-containing protein [Pseudomonadales bacterium]|nr:DUF2970 domain-containing protein [Pseudomonadales bacterium]